MRAPQAGSVWGGGVRVLSSLTSGIESGDSPRDELFHPLFLSSLQGFSSGNQRPHRLAPHLPSVVTIVSAV